MAVTIEDVSVFADGLDHPECVAVHPDGTVWAGGEAGQVYRISPNGKKMDIVANTGGFIQGIAFSPDVSWLAVCDSKHHCVWKLNLTDFQLEKFATGAEGINFNIPNYACFTKDGRLFVSESGAFRAITGKVFCFAPSGKGVIWHPGPFNFANGMAISAKEDYLYVVCTWLPGVERISILSDGSAGKREVFCTLPQTCPDGVAFDQKGNLYVSCYTPNTIYKVSPNQGVELVINDWESHLLSNPTNIAFGGKDFDELFTANLGRWHVSKILIHTVGLKLPSHQ